jgi:hypothetical protein
MIPISTAMWDPTWFKPPKGKEYYIDKRGIICGLRYEPLIVQGLVHGTCPCEEKAPAACTFLLDYAKALETVNFEKMIKAFEFCSNKFQRPFDKEESIIVLMVYEALNNPCSERIVLQKYFQKHGYDCNELIF